MLPQGRLAGGIGTLCRPVRLRRLPPDVLPPSLRDQSADEILSYYRELEEDDHEYIGYSDATLKRTILSAALRLPVTRVVDLGSGPNPVVLFDLHERIPGLYSAVVELSTDFCRHVEAHARKRSVELDVRNASVHETGFEGASFDLAILSETLEHVPDEIEHAVLVEARRILRPGGHLIVSVPSRDCLFERYMTFRRGFFEEHPQHLRDYTPALLRAKLERAGFEIVRTLAVPPPKSDSLAGRLIAAFPIPARWSTKAAFVARPSGR